MTRFRFCFSADMELVLPADKNSLGEIIVGDSHLCERGSCSHLTRSLSVAASLHTIGQVSALDWRYRVAEHEGSATALLLR